ncbi:MAG: glycosyltransferase family 39 protein [Planctomycetota bacterium]
MDPSETPTRPAPCPWTALVVIGAAAAAIRLYVGIRYNLSTSGDAIRGFQFYLDLAQNFVEGRGYHWDLYGPKFANRPPGYPALLAATLVTGVYPWGALVLQSLLGGFAAVLTGCFASRLGSARAGVIAALLVLAWPYSVMADTALIEHALLTVAVLCVALAWWRFARTAGAGSALLLGAALGAGVLVRVTVTASIPMVILAVLLAAPRGKRFRGVLLVTVAAAAVVSPWVVRNARTVGSATLSTDTWRALWVAHNDFTLEVYPAASIDGAERRAWRAMDPETRSRILGLSNDEVAQARVFRGLVLDWVRENPGQVVRGMFVKAGAFFSPVMNPPSDPPAWKSVAYTVSWSAAALGGLVGLLILIRRWREWLVVAALFAGFLASAVLTWGQSRFRAPLDVLLIAAAAVLVDRIFAGKRNLAGPGIRG